MKPFDPILFRELPLIQKIIQDETWLEAERRGCHVRSDDRVVRERVCQVVLRIGQQLRDSLSARREVESESDLPANVTRMPLQDPNEAA